MNIIAGKYSGRKLKSSESARPTLARIKSSLFSIISEYINEECRVLDLFAGSGALGIETISRGVLFADFVDGDKDSIKVLNYNLRNIDKSNFNITHSDYSSALRDFSNKGKKFDIIFIDPPYQSNLGNIAIDMIFRFNLLSERGIIVFESSTNKVLQDFPKGSIMVKERDYGSTKIYIIKREVVL